MGSVAFLRHAPIRAALTCSERVGTPAQSGRPSALGFPENVDHTEPEARGRSARPATTKRRTRSANLRSGRPAARLTP